MISREEAIEKATGVLEEASEGVCYVTEVDVEWLITAIEALSQPERPKGRLVRRRKHYGECPECGEIISKLHNYCSNCGLEIVRGEEE